MTPTRLFSLRIVIAFAAIYLIWGSTYLAIRWAVETLPPFVMAGLRFLSAGAVLLAWARWRGAPWPTPAQWKEGALLGLLLLGCGNGMVSWSAQRVPSGLIAVIIASVPAWVVLLEAAGPRRARPAPLTVLGVALGLGGIAWLVGPGALRGAGGVDPLGAGALLFGCLAWSVGTVRSRGARQPASPLLATSLQMLAGGVVLLAGGTLAGEWARVHPGAVSVRSALSLVYLVVFGAIVAFTAYVWLLRHVEPSRVATYAFVNPVVAVVLGWAFAGESLSGRTLVAAALIIAGVTLVTLARPATRAATAVDAARSGGEVAA
jgi:drug/metabolite transporter (DMT)-like permease